VDYQAWAEQQRLVMQNLLIDGQADDERRMDHLREAHHAQVFRLLVQDLEGRLSLERLSDHLSELADQSSTTGCRNKYWLAQRARSKSRSTGLSAEGYSSSSAR
ncbi:MAG: hypothetical protein EBX54_10035, partial [Betaproteobacteria bacterium]|nr:hypothetical protein [Betaproteobacteria bacterium]